VRWPPWGRGAQPVDDLPRANPEAAEKAKREAQQVRKQVEAQGAYIERVIMDLQRHNDDNHFSEMVWQAMRRKHS